MLAPFSIDSNPDMASHPPLVTGKSCTLPIPHPPPFSIIFQKSRPPINKGRPAHYEQTNWTNCNSINKQKVKFSLPFELLPTPQVLQNVSTSSSLCMLSPSTLVLLAVAKHSCRWFSYNFIYKFFDICCLLNHICGFALCGFSLAKADRIFLSK